MFDLCSTSQERVNDVEKLFSVGDQLKARCAAHPPPCTHTLHTPHALARHPVAARAEACSLFYPPVGQVLVTAVEVVEGKTRVSLSTRKLEPTPGAMLKNPALVFAKAEETAAAFREKLAAAEAAARGAAPAAAPAEGKAQ